MSDPTISTTDGELPSSELEWQPQLSQVAGKRYELEHQLGFGGMATVYRARDHRLRRTVAIKILHRHLIADPEHCARFRREAESIARLDHPGILSIFDLLEVPGEFLAIVMEYVDGPGLDDLLHDAPPLPPELAAELAISLLDALEHAHDHGVVHRDLKPANILIDDGALRLTDFGIAHVADESRLTRTGSVLGSPHFMSPEMAEGQPVDSRADLFSLGSILYLMVTGTRPFEAGSTPAVLRNIAEGRRPRADELRDSVGRNFTSLLERFLAIDADDRPATAAEARDLLDEFVTRSLDDRPNLKRWIKNPQTYTSELISKIEDSLRLRGRTAVDAGDRRRALPLVERLMALSSQDDDARSLLDDLHNPRGERRWRIGIAVALFIVTMATIVAYYASTADDDSPQDITSPAPTAQTSDEAPISETLERAESRGTETASHTEDEARRIAESSTNSETAGKPDKEAGQIADETGADEPDPQSTPEIIDNIEERTRQTGTDQRDTGEEERQIEARAPQTSQVSFRLVPPSATIEIDGEEFDAMEASRGIELRHGTHELVAIGPATKTYETTVDVGPDTEDSHSVVLSWKDGYIRLQIDRDALVWIDGAQTPLRIDGGEPETIPISFGRADDVANERDVSLRIAARDDLQLARQKTVHVRPDTETPVAVTLHEQ